MSKLKIIFALLLVLSPALVSCLKDEVASNPLSGAATLELHFTMPQTEAAVNVADLEVTLRNKSAAFSYTASPDSDGNVTYTVQPGRYDIVASCYYAATRVAVNASCTEFILTSSGIISDTGDVVPSEISLDVNVVTPSPLVIREFYFHGSKTLEGASYTKDRYFEIYNNTGSGGQTVYLDSLCVCTVFPHNSSGSTAWMQEGLSRLPIANMFWMFPGNGTDYPLAPGESAVVAAWAAVDHGGRCTSGLQLNRAHFGCYDDLLSKFHEISATVTKMDLAYITQGTAWPMSNTSPALVLFKPEMGVANLLGRDFAQWEDFEPGKTSGTKYLHISKDWVIDAVETFTGPTASLKRLPSSLDASYVYMHSAGYSGKCITRKKDEIASAGGVDVFIDTNNSEFDFIPDAVPAPRLKEKEGGE